MFEGAALHGSTLHALPAGRAVLPGGVWNAQTLDAVYNGGEPMPNLYAGAPDWVADPVFDPRAASGLLSFCYWWEAGRWCRGASSSTQIAPKRCPGCGPGKRCWESAPICSVPTRIRMRAKRFPHCWWRPRSAGSRAGNWSKYSAKTGRFDIDGALYQYSFAGLAPPRPEPMHAAEAISGLRDYIIGHVLDTTGYPLEQLVAERFSVVWMVQVPVPAGKVATDRAIFYLGDDSVLEQSSTSIDPPVYISTSNANTPSATAETQKRILLQER